MSKNHKRNSGGNNDVTEAIETITEPIVPEQVDTPEATPVPVNFTLTYKRNHPKGRSSYGISGNAGIVVFERRLFAECAAAGDTQPADNFDRGSLPQTITLDSLMVLPKADPKEAAALKAIERANKAKEKIEAAAVRAQAALAKAQAKIKAAADAAAAKATPATPTVATTAADVTELE